MGAVVENDIIQLEYAMWETVVHGDIEGFKKLVRADAVMICGGHRCLWKRVCRLPCRFSPQRVYHSPYGGNRSRRK